MNLLATDLFEVFRHLYKHPRIRLKFLQEQGDIKDTLSPVRFEMKFPKRICDECINKLEDITVFIETLELIDTKSKTNSIPKNEIECAKVKEIRDEHGMIKERTKEYEEEVSFQSLGACRICSCPGELTLLGKETNLALLFQSITNFDVKGEVHFSNEFGICDSCNNKLEDISSFINSSFWNDKKIEYAVDGCNPIKTESCDNDVFICSDLKLKTIIDANDSLNGIKDKYETINVKTENDYESVASTSQLLQSHDSVKEEKPFKCEFCEQSFTEKDNFLLHLLTHTGEKHFKCDRCEKSFTFKHHLQEHLLKGHDEKKQFKCDFCERTFSFEHLLESHRHRHSRKILFKSKFCDKTFPEKCSLKQHLGSHHAEKPYKCECCSRSFKQSSSLQQHMLIHTGEKRFKCHTCEKTFARSSILHRHSLTHTEERRFKCENCDKSFKQPSGLHWHRLTHTGEKPYKCDCCDKSFSRSATLQQHLLTHTGEKRYRCERCDTSFSQKQSLRRHLMLHSKQKLFECDLCGKSFSRRYVLREHMDTHDGEKCYFNSFLHSSEFAAKYPSTSVE